MTIKSIAITVAGVAAFGGVCFLVALARETGRWYRSASSSATG